MNAKKQYGKGLSGFVLGLLLATLVIAGVLFFLNQSNKKAFKEEVQKELPPPPEVLTPKDSLPASAPQLPASSETETASDALSEFIGEQLPEMVSEPEVVAPVAPPRPVTPETPRKEPSSQAKPATKPTAKPVEKKAESKPVTKPTPEQILNSGSIEKARKEAQTEKAQVQKQPQAEAEASSGRVIVQMGSFVDRQSAEAHRAKMAMIGVTSSVSEATINGKKVYRVQSGRLSKAEAESARKTLQQNGVDSFTRSVK